MDYTKSLELLKNRETKKVANNTYLVRLEDCIGLKFHDTIIIKFYKDSQMLQVGGFQTTTTKQRLNTFSSIKINQRNFIWYVNNETPFFDGITIMKDGKIKGKNPNKHIEKKVNAMKKRIDNYIKNFAKHIEDKKLVQPSGGDCFFCQGMMGDSTDHLESHLEEEYFVPSLLLNALRESGYGDIFFHFFLDGKEMDIAKRALKKYLYKRLLKGDK